MHLPTLTGLGSWDALWTVVCAAVALMAIGSIVRYFVKGLYTGEYPKAWEARHKFAFHLGEAVIGILMAVTLYKAYQELRPLVDAALSRESFDPKISKILTVSVLLPLLLWDSYEASRWQSGFWGAWGAKISFAIAFVYAVAILPGMIWR